MADLSEEKSSTILPWVSGAMLAIIGIFALYVSSRAGGKPMYWIGLAIFGLSVLANFYLISRSGDPE